ncbi:MAG: ABC transporter ATP-binding protein [Synechococcaceae cyanobacterium]|jgi:iron complex transport system ATP-binding protein
MSSGDRYLELESVEAWLGPHQVFENLTLALRLGEPTAVLGPNGSGKSSLIRLLGRSIYPVVKPGSWLRIFGSETVNLWELRRRVGLVSQDQQIAYAASVPAAEVVLSGLFGSVGLGRAQQPSPAQRCRALELLAAEDLADLAERPYGQLSQGQQRRLLLARALVHEPQLLVLDEPLQGLDLAARHRLLASLRRRIQAGTTVLLVTHDIEAIVPEIQRCLLLHQGRVLADGPPQEVLRDGPLSALYGTPLRVVSASGFRQVLPAV